MDSDLTRNARKRAAQRWSRSSRPAPPPLDPQAIFDSIPWDESHSADPEIRGLFGADQDDRKDEAIAARIIGHDRQRLARVLELLQTGCSRSAWDRYHAAMVLQHGHLSEHYELANLLAKSAADGGIPEARWLTAATLDRWNVSRALPQKYGTQSYDSGGGWTLYEIDPTTTDAERTEWDVPSLADIIRTLEELDSDEI